MILLKIKYKIGVLKKFMPKKAFKIPDIFREGRFISF